MSALVLFDQEPATLKARRQLCDVLGIDQAELEQ